MSDQQSNITEKRDLEGEHQELTSQVLAPGVHEIMDLFRILNENYQATIEYTSALSGEQESVTSNSTYF